jgi:hypothetical protein
VEHLYIPAEAYTPRIAETAALDNIAELVEVEAVEGEASKSLIAIGHVLGAAGRPVLEGVV